MGLDILLFDKENKRVGKREITFLLHKKIFNGKIKCNWGDLSYLRKIKDYYKTNITLKEKEIKAFSKDLVEIRSFMDACYEDELSGLIKEPCSISTKFILLLWS